ncbi:hypothetical protein ACS0PU_010304 [Formica fusca]
MRTNGFGVPSLITGQLSEHLHLFSRFVFVPSQWTPVSLTWICKKRDPNFSNQVLPLSSNVVLMVSTPLGIKIIYGPYYVNYCKMELKREREIACIIARKVLPE